MILSQPDIDRIGIDAFVGNIIVNIQEDLNGGRSASQISDYYFNNYGLDVTFTEKTANVRLYTESEGWNQSTHQVFFK